MEELSDSGEETLSSLAGTKLEDEIVEVSPSGHFQRFNEEIGRGAFKKVYRGLNSDIGCEVAWNVISLRNIPSEDRKRILEEVKLNKSLDHPNIIRFIAAWFNSSKEEFIIITELVTGGSMRQYLRRTVKTPRLKVLKLWCRGILSGLEYLHTRQPFPVIHRDLKCENIFVMSSNGEVKIGDFGLSTLLRSSLASSILGTPEFMAPEVYEGSYDTKVDIYALGMCLIEMATQLRPFKECTNAASIYKKVINREIPQAFYRILDPEIQGFIGLCLADVSVRPTASELLQHPFLVIDEEDPKIYQPVALAPVEVKTSPIQRKLTVPMPAAPEKTISISLILRDSEKQNLLVSFEYDKNKDTPEIVSEEMVNELELDPAHIYIIAKEIEIRVHSNCDSTTPINISQRVKGKYPGIADNSGRLSEEEDKSTALENACTRNRARTHHLPSPEPRTRKNAIGIQEWDQHIRNVLTFGDSLMKTDRNPNIH